MTAPRERTAPADGNLDLLLVLMFGVFGFAIVLWVGAAAATWVTTGELPRSGGLTNAIRVPFNPADPAAAYPPDAGLASPTAVWIGIAVVTGLLLAALWAGWRLIDRYRASPTAQRQAVHSLPGLASRAEIRRYAGPTQLVRRSASLRPDLEPKEVKPRDVGWKIGGSRGVEVWRSVEDAMVLVGPTRSGKSFQVVVPAILDAPGAVVATSTKPELVAATIKARERAGSPVAVFDPQRLAGLSSSLRWSPIRGCEDPATCEVRAKGFSAATGLSGGGVENGGFWEAQTTDAIRGLLHAAAIGGATIEDLYRWSLLPSAAADAVSILQTEASATLGWADALDSVIRADDRTRDSVWLGVRNAFSPLGHPAVRDAVNPGVGEAFDPTQFIRERGTLYLLSSGSGAAVAAQLVVAMIEDITETARRMAARSAGGRLPVPLAFILDEIANIAKVPSLPTLMSDGGGIGMTTMVVLQTLSQARDRWGKEAAGTMWNSAVVKLVLGGNAEASDLEELSTVIGDRWDKRTSISRGADGHRSSSTSQERIRILTPDQIRRLPRPDDTTPHGVGLVILPGQRPIMCDLAGWSTRSDGDQIAADRTAVEAEIRAAAP